MKQALAAVSALENQLGRGMAPAHGWATALDLVAPRRRAPRRASADSRLIAEGPAGCVNREPHELAALLEAEQRSGSRAAPLRKLAQWWQSQIEHRAEAHAGRRFLDEEAVNQLRRISGISQELSDRIRLFALGEPVVPVGRAALRVGCRHAWCELDCDSEEWQAWFRNWADVAGVELWQLVHWIDEVGSQWCGPQPRCEGCPLAEFLPPGGPREPES
jgi:endonuclease III